MNTGIKMKVCLYLTLCLVPFMGTGRLQAHGYLFSMANEEMRDNVTIELNQNFFLVKYESEYTGQIAPHIRLMIDSDENGQFSRAEIGQFMDIYKQTLNAGSENQTVSINGVPVILHLVTAFGPTLTTDSLLAPFYVELLFSASEFKLKAGENELEIDPRVLFASGTHFLQMAKERVEFSEDQEKAIGRFLQITVTGEDSIRFISTYPGRIRNKDRSAQIYGVFFDKTPLELNAGDYPLIRIKFSVM